jgi:hypothetical protein
MYIDETNFGPFFSSKKKACEWFAEREEVSMEEAEKQLSGENDYPYLEEITLDNTKYRRDR